MATERIDVLAELDAASAALTQHVTYPSDVKFALARIEKTRAAVAELIEAADKVQLAYALMNLDPDFIRLRKALARCGGA